MKKPTTALDIAKFELAQAKAAYDAKDQALTAFRKPFQDKEFSAQSDLYNEQNRLRELRAAWGEALERNEPVGEIEAQISSTEAELKRARGRLDIARAWRNRESGSLEKLQNDQEAAYLDYVRAYQKYMDLCREHVVEAREHYLGVLVEYWALARQAASYFKIPNFRSAELAIEWEEIRLRTGAMWD
jgi:chromosome segregation ATPase